MERLGLTWRLMEAYGLTRLPGAIVRDARRPPRRRISRASTRASTSTCSRRPTAAGRRAAAARYGLGPGDNPIFPGLWEAARAGGGGLHARRRLVAAGRGRSAPSTSPAVCTTPCRERASGFCYVNDAVLAILTLRARGLRVAYVDIDAHHGDGVQAAFYRDPDVMTISTHERGERSFPGTGFVARGGEGAGVGYSVNLPLEAYTDDAVYLAAFDAVVPPLAARLQARRHRGPARDRRPPHRSPHSPRARRPGLRAGACARIVELAPRLVALGGGGYDLQNVARGWTAAWAVINGVELPASAAARRSWTTRGGRLRVAHAVGRARGAAARRDPGGRAATTPSARSRRPRARSSDSIAFVAARATMSSERGALTARRRRCVLDSGGRPPVLALA